MEDHVVDVFYRCRHIVDLVQAGIDKRVFPEGSPGRDVEDDFLT